MSLEIGPDLSPTFSFDRETSSGEKLITFKDNLNPRTDFDQLSKLLATLLDEEEKKCMADLKEYLVKKEEAWILDQKLLNFVGALLENRSLDTMVRVKVRERTIVFATSEIFNVLLKLCSWIIAGDEAVGCGSLAPRLLVVPPAGQEGEAVDEVPQRLRQPLR